MAATTSKKYPTEELVHAVIEQDRILRESGTDAEGIKYLANCKLHAYLEEDMATEEQLDQIRVAYDVYKTLLKNPTGFKYMTDAFTDTADATKRRIIGPWEDIA